MSSHTEMRKIITKLLVSKFFYVVTTNLKDRAHFRVLNREIWKYL